MKTIESKDPRAHASSIRAEFQELIQHLRRDIDMIEDPKAQALFETAAEVLGGLNTAFEHFEQRAEAAWK